MPQKQATIAVELLLYQYGIEIEMIVVSSIFVDMLDPVITHMLNELFRFHYAL
jgi:hypothetical protein